MTLLVQETIEPEVVFDKYETLPNRENSANPVIKCVLQWVKDSTSLLANKKFIALFLPKYEDDLC